MIILGLTGRSGAGKGYVCEIMEKNEILRAKAIDTDKVYHDLLEASEQLRKELVQNFGKEIINSENKVDRTVLSKIVFGDMEKLQMLNKITHRIILDKTDKMIEEAENDGYEMCIVDAPQLFESGFDKKCDVTVGVLASNETLLRRILRRDGITEEKARQRLASQKSEQYFLDNCDYIIYNECPEEELKLKIDELFCKISRENI